MSKAAKRLVEHGQRIGKKVSDALLDIERAQEQLKSQGFTAESEQVKALEAIKKSFDTATISATLKLLKNFPSVST